MFDWMRGLVEDGGYFALAALMFLENVFPPLPSEFIMPLAGFAASEGKMNIFGAIVAGTAGSVLGSLPLYYLGRVLGEKTLERWAGSYGRWLTVSPSDLRGLRNWFALHGSKAVFFGRLVPGVRSLIAVPAGVHKMPLPLFVAHTALGSALWASALAFLGLWLGEKFENVERVLNPVSWILLGGLVAWWLLRVARGSGAQST